MGFWVGNKSACFHLSLLWDLNFTPYSPPPRIIIISDTFSNGLKSLCRFFLCVSGLETSWYILILSLLRNSNFKYLFSARDFDLSNSFLTDLNTYADFFPCVSGLETSQHIFILSLLRDSNFTPYFHP